MQAILTRSSLTLLVAGSLATGVLGAGLLLLGCGSGKPEQLSPVSNETSGSVPAAYPAELREAAPDFVATALDGEQVSAQGFKGQPLVLVFWASW